MNFSFWPFLWFGLPRRLLIKIVGFSTPFWIFFSGPGTSRPRELISDTFCHFGPEGPKCSRARDNLNNAPFRPEKSRKKPELLSEFFLEFPSKVQLGSGNPAPHNSRHFKPPGHFQNSLPFCTAGVASFPEVVPERASQSWSWNFKQY